MLQIMKCRRLAFEKGYDKDIAAEATVSRTNKSLNEMKIDPKVEENTEAYTVKLNTNIENINKFLQSYTTKVL